MQDKITLAIDALILAAVIEGGVSDEKLPASRELTNLRTSELIEAISAPCLHQIQEPAPATALDALREAEAALEVAIARILKANPGHSICVTSEAKALVAVRSALAATPAEKSNSVEFDGIKTAAPVVLPEPDDRAEFDRYWLDRQRERGFGERLSDEEMLSRPERRNDEFHAWQAGRALLATGGKAQAEAVEQVEAPSDEQAFEHFVSNCDSSGIQYHGPGCECANCANGLGECLFAPQADARDAERYRWLRKSPNPACDIRLATHFGGGRGQDFEALIDAAIAAAKGE